MSPQVTDARSLTRNRCFSNLGVLRACFSPRTKLVFGRGESLFWRAGFLLVVILFLPASAYAQESAAPQSSGGGVQMYVLPYILVLLCIGLGTFMVCTPSRRRERPKMLEWKSALGIAEAVEQASGPPQIGVGMRIEQVTKLLGKPKIARRGSEIYRELFQAGKLSEDEAAKEYLTYEHPAGRYELVVLDRRVVQVRRQPPPVKKEGSAHK